MEINKKEVFILTFVTLIVCLFINYYSNLYTPYNSNGEKRAFEIKKGESFSAIAISLKQEGFIKDKGPITFAAGLKRAYKKIKAGEYELSSKMSPMQILNLLITGSTKIYKLTVPEGYNLALIASLVEDKRLGKKDRFLNLSQDKKFIKSLGLDTNSLEGYLFPETYHFTRQAKEEDIIIKMYSTFIEIYEREISILAENSKFTKNEIVTLASIIEKETSVKDEMVIISEVFQLRLIKGIRLRTDPTVIYGIKNYDGNIRKKDLLMKTPYNTYINYGLTPTPIASPGLLALKAVFNPTNLGYLYFVSKNDGTHYFSKTLREHNNAVRFFQLGQGRRPL